MSVEWDVEWCPVSRKTTPLGTQKTVSLDFDEKEARMAASGNSKIKNRSHLTNSHRRYMAEILPIQCKLYPINQSIMNF